MFALSLMLLMAAGIPPPTGRYTVGRQTLVFTDPSRPEALTKDPGAKREFSAHVWYPCMPGSGLIQELMPDLAKWREALGEDLVQSALDGALAAVEKTRPRVRVGGTPLNGRYPLVVFFPALGANTLSYTSLLSELASFGYMVIALDPPYEVFAVTLRDNRIVGFHSPGWSQPPRENILRYEEERIKVWAADARFALNEIQKEGRPRSVDWQRIGTFGHSAGALAAIEFCRTDPRVRLCLNLDGLPGKPPFPAEPGSTFEKPLGMIHGPLPDDPRQHQAAVQAFQSVKEGSLEITIGTPGIHHRSYLDFSLLKEHTGAAEAMSLIRTYVVAFFDKMLRHKMGTILDRETPPEVHVENYSFQSPVREPSANSAPRRSPEPVR
ncbi:MAG TPA: hypothetical protein VM120_27050 [Bryobacteraceae bacterium]|nr:hypothetical protein [Bryobacteraceae bacterium]